MPYCTNCGRKLEDGEVCNCSAPAQAAQVQQQASPPQPYIPPQQGYGPQPYGGYPQYGQPYPGQPYPYPPNYQFAYDGQALPPPPKPSNKWILAIIIPFAVFFVVMIVLLLAVYVPSIKRYKNNSKQAAISSKASSIYRAANSTRIALKEDELVTEGDYIISSDSSKNVAVPFDVEKFYKKENFYFDKASDYNYFIVVRDGYAVYAAVSDSWNSKKEDIGTYPSKYTGSIVAYSPVKYSPEGENVLREKNETLSDFYRDACEKFNEDIKRPDKKEW